MKKRIWIFILLAALLLLPHAASANAPAPNPWEIKVAYTNVPKDAQIDVYVADGDSAFRRVETHTVKQGKSLCFYMEEGDTAFYIAVIAADGTETLSNIFTLEEYGSYSYDGGTNILGEKTSASASGDSAGFLTEMCRAGCETGGKIALYFFACLLMPIALTLLLEWLTALCFGIRPVKYVFAINALTNPAMNVILLIVLLITRGLPYWIALGVLELAVVGVEFRFYTRKYQTYARGRLLLFAVVANAVSLAAGIGLQALLL